MRNRMVTGALCATVLIGVAPIAAANAATGPMGFDPIDGSAYDDASTAWSEPYVAPDGFTQTLVADETVLDIYPGADDLTDMNVTNETGQEAGRYLYRTHEGGANGSLSVVDLHTGEAKVIEQQEYYNRLDVMNRNFVRRLHHHAMTAQEQGMFLIDKQGVIRHVSVVGPIDPVPGGAQLADLVRDHGAGEAPVAAR